MWTEGRKTGKLSAEILLLLAVSGAAAVVFFLLSDRIVYAVCHRCLLYAGKLWDSYLLDVMRIWSQGISLLAAALFFVILFLMLLRRKLRYLGNIIQGIEALRMHRMNYEIPVEGENELSELAMRINELSKTEQELIRKEEALSREREGLIRAVAHDIRTPITSVLSYAELLAQKENRSEEEVDAFLELTQRKGLQMKELLEGLLENKVGRRETFERGTLLIRQLVDEWETVLSESFQVETDWSECREFSGSFEVEGLFRIFDNLLSNIRKYADPSYPVSLQVKVTEGKLILTEKNRIQVGNREEESYGLGLLTVGRIAERHCGGMEYKKKDGFFEIRIEFPVNL